MKRKFRELYYCSYSTLDCCPYGRFSRKINFSLWRHRKKRIGQKPNQIFETCLKTFFTGKKNQGKLYSTGSRKDRSQRERYLTTKFASIKPCFLKICSKISEKIWLEYCRVSNLKSLTCKFLEVFCALAFLQNSTNSFFSFDFAYELLKRLQVGSLTIANGGWK